MNNDATRDSQDDRLVARTENDEPVHYWRMPVTRADLEFSEKAGARIGGYFIDAKNGERLFCGPLK